jgi:hypothetical protein
MSTVTVTDPIQSPEAEDFERIYREHAPLVYRTAWGCLADVRMRKMSYRPSS